MKEAYFDMMAKYPLYFKNIPENGIIIYTDAEEISRIEKSLGKEIGIMYQDDYMILLRDAVCFPNGEDGCYIRILPAVTESPVVVLPVINGKILLMKHFRHSIRSTAWEIPRGFGEKGLSAQENAEKELKEETGLEDARIQFLGWVTPDTGMMASKAAVYRAEVSGDVKAENNDSNEAILNYKYASLEELKKMVKNGEIEDGFTLSALALAILQGGL